MTSLKVKFLILTLPIFLSCKKDVPVLNVPDCIQERIILFSQNPCEKKRVQSYHFQNKVVYSFDQIECGPDGWRDIYDSDCNYLGLLGGFGSIRTIDGEDFSKAVLLQTILGK